MEDTTTHTTTRWDLGNLLDRAGLWPARVLWLIAPAIAGPAVARLLDDRADTPALVVEIVLWALWFGVLVAALVPSPWSLTAYRIAAPAAAAGAIVIMATDGVGPAAVGALAWAMVTTVVCFLPVFGDRMVNGSAYGSERRMTLRPPGFVLIGPAQVAWLAVFAGLFAPLALVLAERWVLAAVATVIGGLAAWAGARILNQLARRWVVFVPAGFVIRDPMQLVDAVLLRRTQVLAVGPALADPDPDPDPDPEQGAASSERTDLTAGARGLALEVATREPAPITLRVRNEPKPLETANIMFTPTLPGAMVREARIRGLKIDTVPER